MISEAHIKSHIRHTIEKTNFEILGARYQGKVRDNYTDYTNNTRIIIATDRISAFDRVMGVVPYKGQVLNQLATYWFEETADVAPSHFISSPDPNITVAKLCTPFPIEVIVRNYITGSLWREYERGEDNYGLQLAPHMQREQKFDQPIITPSTKAESGHDMPMKRQEVTKLVPEEKYQQIEKMALELFARGSSIAAERGLLLVDTKYEFGETVDGDIVVIDEIHTPDSSRYWMSEGYAERFQAGKPQRMLDKEYIRQWLIERNYTGQGDPPPIEEMVIVQAALKYIELYTMLTGQEFSATTGDIEARMRTNLTNNGFQI